MSRKISIIVPVYNVENYLQECIDSIAAQSYPDFEAILVDDGSTDASPAICDDIARADSRFRVIHTENHGPSAARRTGLEASIGDYIVFVDSDDLIHPQFCTRLMSAIIADPQIDIAICRMSDKRLTLTSKKPELFSPAEAIADTLYQHKLHCSHSAKIYKHRLLRGDIFPAGYYEDLAAFADIILNSDGKIAYIPDRLYFYRRTPNSRMNRFDPARLIVLDIVDTYQKRFAHDPVLAMAATDRKYSANYNIYLLTRRLPQHKTVAADCLRVVKQYRRRILLNRHSRLKNKIGAILSLFLRP